MKTKYLISNNIPERMDFIKKVKPFGKRIAIYNQIPLRGLESYFDKWVKLTDLYKDEIFLKLLAEIDQKTTVFFIDLGLDYCSFQANYIKPYTKLSPIFHQAKDTYLIDGFAFYNTEKSIYRPFLYIDDSVLDSSVQEFYNSGALYKDFDGNKVENYYQKIKPYIKISTKSIDIETISYNPTEEEKSEYEKLKENVIMTKKYPKAKVIKTLLDFIDSSNSKQKSILPEEKGVLNVVKNNNNSRKQMYKDILMKNPNKLIFYSSGVYGVDEIELSRTKDALIRHNKLIKLING